MEAKQELRRLLEELFNKLSSLQQESGEPSITESAAQGVVAGAGASELTGFELPADQILPEEYFPRSDEVWETEPASSVSALRRQLTQAIGHLEDGHLEHKLLQNTLDYVAYMAIKLQSVTRSPMSEALDKGFETAFRRKIVAEIRAFCTEQWKDRPIEPSDEEVKDRLLAVQEAEHVCTMQEDVASKKIALAAVWDTVSTAMVEIAQGCDQAQDTITPDGYVESAVEEASKAMEHESKMVEEGHRLCQHHASQFQQDLIKGTTALESMEAALKDEFREVESATADYEEELQEVMALIAPRLQSLSSKFARAKTIHDKYENHKSMFDNARVKWDTSGSNHRENIKMRIEQAQKSVEVAEKALMTFRHGCQHIFNEILVLDVEQQKQKRQQLSGRREAVVQLYQKAWISLQQTKIKNEALIEEWELDEVRLKEELQAALERLDPVQEKSIKSELNALRERRNEVLKENDGIQARSGKIEAAFAPVKEMLESGQIGTPLSKTELVQNGLNEEEWAVFVGDTIARDLQPELEEYRITHRQHRLEQLRKNHKREFEMIQKMKERLQCESQLIKRSPLKDALIENEVPQGRMIENASWKRKLSDIFIADSSFGKPDILQEGIALAVNKRRRQ
mmetsp:Transcript_25000/g.39283  ORF Transcript_25000/g.39283 Transcript_25000/m.39283 type:complete len:627 (-) Transcript_25000:1173-3053(-)|eukprot:CAMPEP_0184325808 /NCGR_PEP_ID=MMETSP1049-20130417/142225_1 /TAXON_ID=77928 /ORGANISM="Proteomonas sulcata, Strain CCMP704" /LENGTH=626 /DNA_ID=CAMNT_0026647965 /DNA_START=397 /DNA_END=2277 /DNA_ORIENTATION=+